MRPKALEYQRRSKTTKTDFAIALSGDYFARIIHPACRYLPYPRGNDLETIRKTSRLAQRFDPALEYWIGWSQPPVQREINESGWNPDGEEIYCPRCGVTVGSGEATPSGCASCRRKPKISDGVVRLGAYRDPLRQWILGIKFGSRWEMGRTLGGLLGRRILASGQIGDGPRIVVPLPMPWSRRWYRGIDHTAEIARGVAKVLRCPVAQVLRKSNGPPQMLLSPTRRIYGAGARLSIRRGRIGKRLAGKTLILVDDVKTTGGSIRAAYRLLDGCCPTQIVAAVLAVADDPSRRAGDKGDSGSR